MMHVHPCYRLKAWPGHENEIEPKVASGIVSQKVGFGFGPVLLSNGENAHGESARQGHNELVQRRKVQEQGG